MRTVQTARYGAVRSGTERYGVVRRTANCAVRSGTERYGAVRSGTGRHDKIRNPMHRPIFICAARKRAPRVSKSRQPCAARINA